MHVEVNGTEAEGLALQHRLPELCRRLLLPAVERALDRLAPQEGHWYLEKLEIDAGSLSLDRLDEDLPGVVEQALEKILRERYPAQKDLPGKISGEDTFKTEPQLLFEAFVHFLKTGSLPWSFRLPDNQTLEQAVAASRRKTERTGGEWGGPFDEIRRALSSPLARRRLALQFSTGFVLKILGDLSPQSASAVEKVLQAIAASQRSDPPAISFEQALLKTALALTVDRIAFTEKQLIEQTWIILPILPEKRSQWESLIEDLERQWPGVLPESLPEQSRRPRTASPDGETTPDSAERSRNVPKQAVTAEEGIFVKNAGLVLLHPFLPRFFEGLGIARDKEILHPERALALLHFLSAGQTVTPEYELTLPKLLCRVPFETPVPFDVDLREEEIEEAEALLKAVIHHWEALRNTTADGLRGNFLIRPGKLSRREDGDWLLQVEPKTHDVLLNHLPWGLGMIQLPWMDRMLWVEWN